MAFMQREDLMKAAPVMTACPFSKEQAKAEVDAKQIDIVVGNAPLVEQAMSQLWSGNLSEYRSSAAKLKGSPFICAVQKAEDIVKKAAEDRLKNKPPAGIVRFTFAEEGDVGMRLSKDEPPWILQVHPGGFGSRKAPKLPVAGVVVAVNGHELIAGNCQAFDDQWALRPLIMDVLWPTD